MASIITLDGVGATDEYGNQIPDPGYGWGDATQTLVGWGLIAFAAGTAFFRLKNAVTARLPGRQYQPTRAQMQGFFGRRRRRR